MQQGAVGEKRKQPRQPGDLRLILAGFAGGGNAQSLQPRLSRPFAHRLPAPCCMKLREAAPKSR